MPIREDMFLEYSSSMWTVSFPTIVLHFSYMFSLGTALNGSISSTNIVSQVSEQSFIFHSESSLAVTHVSFLVTVYKVHFIHIKQLLSQGVI